MDQKLFEEGKSTLTNHRFASGNIWIDGLIRWENWNNATGKPPALKYKIDNDKFYNQQCENGFLKQDRVIDVVHKFFGENYVYPKLDPISFARKECYSVPDIFDGTEVYYKENMHGFYNTSNDYYFQRLHAKINSGPKNQSLCLDAVNNSKLKLENFTYTPCATDGGVGPENCDRRLTATLKLDPNLKYCHFPLDYNMFQNLNIKCSAGISTNPYHPNTTPWHTKSTFQSSLQLWTDVANVKFVEVGLNSQAHLVISLDGGEEDYPDWQDGLMTKMLVQTWGSDRDHHMIGHTFIDHPRDNVLADVHGKYYKFYQEYKFDPYHPFSEYMTVMSQETKTEFSGKKQKFNPSGTTVNSLTRLTPMPSDIQAIQYLYGKNCSVPNKTLKLNGKTKASILEFDTPEDAIFAFFSCGNNATIDLSEYNGKDHIILDLEPAHHLNIIGKQNFMIAYDTHVKNIIMPNTKADINILTSVKGSHNIILGKVEGKCNIWLHQGETNIFYNDKQDFDACNLLGFNPQIHHQIIDQG